MGRLRATLAPIVRDLCLNTVVNGRAFPRLLRGRTWRLAGHQVGAHSTVNPDCFLGGWSGLTVGEGTFVNYGCFFDLAAPTVIGRNVHIGYQVMLCTASHRLGGSEQRAGDAFNAPIVIEDGVWIGARSVILPGVTIRAGAVIAAGSVVTVDCEPNSLYAGTPATRKRALSPSEMSVVR